MKFGKNDTDIGCEGQKSLFSRDFLIWDDVRG